MTTRLRFIAPWAYALGGVAVWLDYLLPGLEEMGFECILGLVFGDRHDVQRYLVGRASRQIVAIQNVTGSSVGRRRSRAECIVRVHPDAVLGVNIGDVFLSMRRIRCRSRDRPNLTMTVHGIEADLLADMEANADLIDGVIASNGLARALSASVGGTASGRVHCGDYGVRRQEENAASN